MRNTTTMVTFHNLKRARQLSNLVRTAFEGVSNGVEHNSLEIPEKYNHPTVIRFLETGILAEGGLKTIDDIPAIMNAANYWDIPDLLRFCGQALKEMLMGADAKKLDLLPPTITNATPLQRRQFIELMHHK